MITSASNQKIKQVKLLLSSAKERRLKGVFIAEGIKMFNEAPRERLKQVFVSESALKDIDVNSLSCEVETVADDIYKKMSDTVTPQGVLCVIEQNNIAAEEFLKEHRKGNLRLLILEGIQDPGNLGTMIRTAEAAGFDAIIADKNTADVYNPKVIRSTMGSVYRVPVYYSEDLIALLDKLAAENVQLIAAHLKGTADYDKTGYLERVGVMIGNEGRGLSEIAASKASLKVRIPMCGRVESLNAAIAAALMMFEANKGSERDKANKGSERHV